MKKGLIYVVTVALVGGILSACTPLQQEVKKEEKVADVSLPKKVSSTFKPFYIYTEDGSMDNHFCPSGWMGDISDLKIDGGHIINPQSGKNCFKVSYSAKGPNGWAGIYWQEPPNNWGTMKGGFDLTGATRLTFWIRGEKGGERIGGFTVGGIMDGSVSSDTCKANIGPVMLTKEWKQYTIDLRGKDLSNIISGLSWAIGRGENPQGATFYLDDVRFE